MMCNVRRVSGQESLPVLYPSSSLGARLAAQGRRLGPGGAGDCLRTNFRVVLDTVRSCDGHLLSSDEHALLETFQVCFMPLLFLFTQHFLLFFHLTVRSCHGHLLPPDEHALLENFQACPVAATMLCLLRSLRYSCFVFGCVIAEVTIKTAQHVLTMCCLHSRSVLRIRLTSRNLVVSAA